MPDLDSAIQLHNAWPNLTSGRKATAAVRAVEEFNKTCTPPACDLAKRKRLQLLRGLQPYLQCPPVAERPSDVDPTFKNYTLPEDSGG
ncbi:MAG TPA: hypothetical protein VEO92_05170 [Candidatus Nitrosocosmicus sp.]|nr:hypothetical protein [Candidatus Nitrosocosmicus sp.]